MTKEEAQQQVKALDEITEELNQIAGDISEARKLIEGALKRKQALFLKIQKMQIKALLIAEKTND